MPPILLRFLPYGIAVLALVGGFLYYGHARFEAGEAKIQAVLDEQRGVWQANYDKQVVETARIQAEWDRTKEKESEIKARLDAVSADNVNFVRSLRDYRARLSAMSQAASTPAESAVASRESDDLAGLEERHFAACARDSERLTQWQKFYQTLQETQ